MNLTIRRHRGTLVVRIPLETRNPLNGSQKAYMAKARVRKAQRAIVAQCMRPQLVGMELPVCVLVSRIAPRPLDRWDGLGAALKAVIDGIADAFGTKDSDPRIRWDVDQTRGGPGEYAVEICITSHPAKTLSASAT